MIRKMLSMLLSVSLVLSAFVTKVEGVSGNDAIPIDAVSGNNAQNTAYQIEDVKTFYVADGVGGNGQYYVKALYYDQQNNAHIVMSGTSNNTPKKNLEKAEIYIPGKESYVVTDASSEIYEKVTVIQFLDSDSKILGDVKSDAETWYVDINLNRSDIPLSKEFSVSLDYKENGFDIEAMPIEVILKYKITKSVFRVNDTLKNSECEVVRPGDVVTYQIVVENEVGSNVSIEAATLTDQLPQNVFSEETIRWSADQIQWNELSDHLVNTGLYLVPGESAAYYVKATVNNDLAVSQDTTYTNTAILSGTGLVEASDTADVIVEAPKVGKLVINKVITQEYDKDHVPETDRFTFTVDFDGINKGPYQYTIGSVEGVVEDGGTFSLKAGESITIENVPVGAFTVTETQDEDYFTYIGKGDTKQPGNKATGTIVGNSVASVTFTNEYKKHLADLTIEKNGAQSIDENQSFLFTLEGMGIKMDVMIRGNSGVTIKDLPVGDYTVTEDPNWSWRYLPDEKQYSKEITITAQERNTLIVRNIRTQSQWLNGDSYCENRFIPADIAINEDNYN